MEGEIKFEVETGAKPADIALLQFTSGSTSDPKGVAITHANIVHQLLAQPI